jgi:murein DD-endopeptidase MepM/ murein hydrolase activator NlpD
VRGLIFALTLVFLSSGSLHAAPEVHFLGGQGFQRQNSGPCLTEAQRAAIRAQIKENEKVLIRKGLLPMNAQQHPLFSWPIRQNPALHDPSFWAISNFIDENVSFPNEVLDYNGGNRTYDTAAGYNHQGTDIFGWPFNWAKFYLGEIRILAAAPGVIVGRDDGHFDRNCSFTPADTNWNAVYVRNDDGSQIWYGHMRRGSQTTKPVGARVQKGEFLGLMGSSGISTGPHLHFEVYDSANHLIDPWQGPSNHHNPDTWWLQQKPYRDSTLNRLQTHLSPPTFFTCGRIESIAASDTFRPGQNAVFAAYYHDQQSGQSTTYSILKPDGSMAMTWTYSSPQTYSASYWYWSYAIPQGGPSGSWKFTATYLGKTATHIFTVTSTIPQFQVTAISPASVKAGTEVQIHLTGNGFVKGLGATVAKANGPDDSAISVVSLQIQSDTQATIQINVAGNAIPGLRNLNLIRPDYLQTIKKGLLRITN